MKVKYLLLDEEGGHYSLQLRKGVNDTSLKLFMSKYGQWAEAAKGKLSGKLECDGNGVDISLGGRQSRLNYMEVQELYLILKEYCDIVNMGKMKKVVLK